MCCLLRALLLWLTMSLPKHGNQTLDHCFWCYPFGLSPTEPRTDGLVLILCDADTWDRPWEGPSGSQYPLLKLLFLAYRTTTDHLSLLLYQLRHPTDAPQIQQALLSKEQIDTVKKSSQSLGNGILLYMPDHPAFGVGVMLLQNNWFPHLFSLFGAGYCSVPVFFLDEELPLQKIKLSLCSYSKQFSSSVSQSSRSCPRMTDNFCSGFWMCVG